MNTVNAEKRAGASGLKCIVCGDPLCDCQCFYNGSALAPDYLHELGCPAVSIRGAGVYQKPRVFWA